nr:MAG TPA: hypothetical protein [Caudoviricetes sp.]
MVKGQKKTSTCFHNESPSHRRKSHRATNVRWLFCFFTLQSADSIRRYYWKKFPLRGKEGAKDFPTRIDFFWPFRYANPI